MASHKTEYDEAQKTEPEHTDDYGYLNCPEGFRDMLLAKENMGVTISPGEQIRLAEKLSADTSRN